MELGSTAAEKDEFSPKSLYDRMEMERQRNNGTGLRELYAPCYLAKLLRQNIPRQIPVLCSTTGNENNVPFDSKWFKHDPTFSSCDRQMRRFDGSAKVHDAIFRGNDKGNLGRRKRKASSDNEIEMDDITRHSVIVPVEQTYFMDQAVKSRVEKILRFGKVLLNAKILNLNKFCRHFCEEIKSPPLELIWLLDAKYDLLGTSAYLITLMQKEYYLSSTFAYQFLTFCTSPVLVEPETRAQSFEMLEHFLKALVVADACNSKKNEGLCNVKNYSQDILHQVTIRLVSATNTQVLEDSMHVPQRLLNAISLLPLPASVRQKYFLRQLDLIMSLKCKVTAEQVVQEQEKYGMEPGESFLRSVLYVFIEPPQVPSRVVELIFSKFRNAELVNWENLLLCITLWEKLYNSDTEAVRYFRDSIRKLMYEGLEGNEKDKVTAAFVVARHCSLIAPETFFRYEKWYNSVFGSENASALQALPVFNFFTEYLTQLIPIEPICFLQVQATYWPYIPSAAGCKTLWSDYITAAKERVQEYNEIEGAMEFELTANTPLQRDVEMATKAFSNSNKLPQFILEMIMFRKKYYVEQFLPALLKQPPGTARTDARLRLIEVLNAESKMPAEMYAKYKRGYFN